MTESQESTAIAKARLPIRTLRFKVRAESYAWLNAAAVETNQVWNYFNATSYKAIRPFAGRSRCLSGFDLCNLSAGATEYFEHIGANTIQRIATEFAVRRDQFKKAKLRWRVSSGSKRSLGWIPFKADGDRLAAGQFCRSLAAKIAQAQRRGHLRQAKRLHRKASRRRHNAQHQFSRCEIS